MPLFSWRTAFVIIAAGSCVGSLPVVNAQGQSLPQRGNYLFDAQQPPGYVAGAQSMKRPSSYGTFQAVSISGPNETRIALARDGQFLPPLENPVATAMMVGAVYRVRVTNIPFRPGQELYPTIEILDRLYAPPGREHRFPIPVVLTEEDLRLAMDGALVTRVIYLEDSENANPLPTPVGDQMTTNVLPSDNALKVADQLGKPVAILRIGSRVPATLEGDLSHFVFGSPPWIPLPAVPNKADFIDSGRWVETIPGEPTLQPNSERPGQDFPRLPATSPAYVP
ncbi:MAG: hypothetical protein AB8B50_04540 [Pirellulaceae bacterium]